MSLRTLQLLVFLFGTAAMPLWAQKTHTIRLVHPSEDRYAFVPGTITASPGDHLVFSVESGGPYIIGFEPADLTARYRGLLDAAFPDRSGPLRSPSLPGPGSRFELVVPELPKGRYRFASVTHVAYRMAGVLVVP